MIVPHSRLLLWTALLVVPCATLAGLAPNQLVPLGFLLAAFGGSAVLDAWLARRALGGIGVQLPTVVRLSKDRPGRIEMRLRNHQQRARRLRVGLGLPAEILARQVEILAQLPEGAEFSRLSWECTPSRRGRYFLEACYLEALSPLGFWAWRASTPLQTEIRVYPNLLHERKNLAAVFLNRAATGIHAQRQVGQGRDFEKLREYIPGDSFEEIHWKATAKRGHPVTKVFQIERTQEVYVIVDSSRLSAQVLDSGSRIQLPRPSAQSSSRPELSELPAVTRDSVLERFLTAALILGQVAQRQGDAFGVASFSDRIHSFVRAKTGKNHYAACRDALFALQPSRVTPDYEELFSFIRLRLRRRALLVFLTDLDDPLLAESFIRNLEIIQRQHLVLVHMLRPPGTRPLFSQSEGQTIDDVYHHLGGHLRWEKLRELERILKRRGVHLSLLEQEALSAQMVAQYMSVKQRQLI